MPNNHDNYFQNLVAQEPTDHSVDQSSSLASNTNEQPDDDDDNKLNRLQLIDVIGQLILNSKLVSQDEDRDGEVEQQQQQQQQLERTRPRLVKKSFEDIDKHLSEEDRKLIQEAISKTLINRLKNMYAVTTRSR